MRQDGPGAKYADQLSSAEPAVAERRGVWTTVVLAGTDGFSAMCITDDSTHLFAKDMIGWLGTPTDYAAPAPRALTATDLGTGTMNAGDISLAAGTAGSDIVEVVTTAQPSGTCPRPCRGDASRSGYPAASSRMRRAMESRSQ
jgi:hypothetical protein